LHYKLQLLLEEDNYNHATKCEIKL